MTAENKLYFQAEKEAIFLILTGIGDEIYSTVDACNTAKEMWTAIERLQQGESLNVQDVKTNLFWEFGKFTSRDGESMESYYSRFYKLMNELTRNNLQVSQMQVNVQFLQQLQPEWSRFVTVVKQREEIDTVSYHKLFDVLKQFQNEVNDIRSERLARSANPLALLAAAQPYSDNYYQAPKPQRSNAPSYTQSSSTRPSASTRHKGKEIAKPVTPQSESVSEEDSDPEQARRDKDMQKNLALLAKYFKKLYKPTNNNLRTSSNSTNKTEDTTPRYNNDNQSRQFGNQRTVTVAGARETVGSPVVQKTGIQCFNCKGFGHYARECRKPKRVKDYAYHKEKMMMCKQAEQGVPLQAEQADWLEDTDEEIDEQELEAHYSYMAKIQEVSPAESSSTDTPLEQVQNHDENDVFDNVRRHSEQPESINDTYVLEKDDSNVVPDPSNICTNDNQVDQNATECVDERDALANLIANLTLDNEENKTFLKQLKKANASLTQELKECKTNLDESSRALGEATSSRDSSLIALQTKQTELEKYTALNDLTSEYKILQTKLNDTLGLLAIKDIDIQKGLKTKTYEISVVNQKYDELVKKSLLNRSQFEGQLKEKSKVISDLKVKEGKDIDTMIEMDKQIKFLNEILYKRNQSIQTIHMLAPKCATYHGRSTFANPKYLKKAQSDKPRLYEIPYDTSDPANRFCPDGEDTVTLEKESRSKLDKDKVKPYNYTYQNSLYETFKPPSKAYLDQLERAKEVRKTMWRKTFVRTKPNIAKNIKPRSSRQMMSDHNSSDLAPQRQEMSVENVSSGLVPQGQSCSLGSSSDFRCPRSTQVFSNLSEKLDVKTAFLNGPLKEEVFVAQPEGFVDQIIQGKKSYFSGKLFIGFKAAPRADADRGCLDIGKALLEGYVSLVINLYAGLSMKQNCTAMFPPRAEYGGVYLKLCSIDPTTPPSLIACAKQTVVAKFITEAEYVAASSYCGQAKTVNWEVQLQALVDGKKIVVTEVSVRRDLQLEDAEGVDCLPNAIIFEQLTLMSDKTTAWNEFSSTMASTIICLANNQKFNFSKYIFESIVKNLDSAGKFLMYPRQGKDFSGRVTPLFSTMIVKAQQEQGEADEAVYEEMDESLERATTTATGLDAEQDRGNISKTQSKATPNEPSSIGTSLGGSPRRQDTIGDTIAQTSSLPGKHKDCSSIGDYKSEKESQEAREKEKEDASKQGRKIHNINVDEDITLDNVHDADMFGVYDLDGDEVFVETNNLSDVDMTLAQALTELKSAKTKGMLQMLLATTKSVVTRPRLKGLVIQDGMASSTQ
ncbi:retrovirus-related pol polyprotein from transposon TNT 1-94 [Tanacetum coccineum]